MLQERNRSAAERCMNAAGTLLQRCCRSALQERRRAAADRDGSAALALQKHCKSAAGASQERSRSAAGALQERCRSVAPQERHRSAAGALQERSKTLTRRPKKMLIFQRFYNIFFCKNRAPVREVSLVQQGGAPVREVSQKWGEPPSHCRGKLTFGLILIPNAGRESFF